MALSEIGSELLDFQVREPLDPVPTVSVLGSKRVFSIRSKLIKTPGKGVSGCSSWVPNLRLDLSY